MSVKYFAGAKFEEGDREHLTNPTESMTEAFMIAKAYSERGCLDVTFYVMNNGESTGIPFSDIENLADLKFN